MPPQGLSEEEAYKGFVRRKSRRISEDTLNRYWGYVVSFLTWLEGNAITPHVVDEYHSTKIQKNYSQNSETVVNSGLNWYLRFKRLKDEEDEPLRFPIPGKEEPEHKRLLTPDEWQRLHRHLIRVGDLLILALVLVLRDSLLRPSDIVSLEVRHLDLDGERPCIRKRQVKTGSPVRAFLTAETVSVLRRYMQQYRPMRFVFEVSPGRPFHRRWPLEALERMCPKAGLTADITPRVFRRTGATNWKGDPKDLQLQGGWKDLKTVFIYRQAQDDRHYDAFQRTFEPKRPDTPEEDPAFR